MCCPAPLFFFDVLGSNWGQNRFFCKNATKTEPKTHLTIFDKCSRIEHNKKEHSGKSTAKLAPPAVSLAWMFFSIWLREPDLNWRPSGYEPDELPSCSIPRYISSASLVPTCIVYHNSAHLSTKNQNFKIKQCFMYVIQNNQKYNQHYSI